MLPRNETTAYSTKATGTDGSAVLCVKEDGHPKYTSACLLKSSLLWQDLVKGCPSCALTKTDGRLPAFSGTAKLFGKATADESIAGLGRSGLIGELDWSVQQPQRKISSDYRDPTRSWVAVDEPIRPSGSAAQSRHVVSIRVVTYSTLQKVTPLCYCVC